MHDKRLTAEFTGNVSPSLLTRCRQCSYWMRMGSRMSVWPRRRVRLQSEMTNRPAWGPRPG